jgi:pimeloyl-ACP methyl ester carboxylesterase
MRHRVLAFLLLASPAALSAQAASSYTLILRAGGDTIAIERITRTPTRVDGDLLVRPANIRLEYGEELAADARVTRITFTQRRATDAPTATPQTRADITFTADSGIAQVSTGGGPMVTQRFAIPHDALPFFNPSLAVAEQAIMRAKAVGGTGTIDVPMVSIAGAQPVPTKITWVGSDSAVVAFGPSAARVAVDAAGHILGGTIPSQQLTIDRGAATSESAMRVEKPDYSAPPGAPYTAVDVVVPTSRGYTLAGTLTIPKNARGRVPAVVTITGSGPEDRDEAIPPVKGYRPFRELADTLGRRGIAVLRMDDRGFGGSGGDGATATSDDFAQDIESGLAYLRTRPEIDATRLALVGHSEGGLIAPIVAARDPKVRAIVLMAGTAYTGRRILEFQNRYALDHNPKLSASARDSIMRTVPHTLDSLSRANRWISFFLDYDPIPTARRVRQPVLIVQGATDQQVTPEQADTLAAALRAGGNRDVTVHVFPETNHLFIRDPSGNPSGYPELPEHTVRRDALGLIADWLAARLR